MGLVGNAPEMPLAPHQLVGVTLEAGQPCKHPVLGCREQAAKRKRFDFSREASLSPGNLGGRTAQERVSGSQ